MGPGASASPSFYFRTNALTHSRTFTCGRTNSMESTNHPTDAVQPDRSALHELHALGQSVWLDYIRRGILDNGELEEMIRRYDLRGVTSNPSIFEQAIGDSDDYDDAFDLLATDGADAVEAYESMAVEDIRQ